MKVKSKTPVKNMYIVLNAVLGISSGDEEALTGEVLEAADKAMTKVIKKHKNLEWVREPEVEADLGRAPRSAGAPKKKAAVKKAVDKKTTTKKK